MSHCACIASCWFQPCTGLPAGEGPRHHVRPSSLQVWFPLQYLIGKHSAVAVSCTGRVSLPPARCPRVRSRDRLRRRCRSWKAHTLVLCSFAGAGALAPQLTPLTAGDEQQGSTGLPCAEHPCVGARGPAVLRWWRHPPDCPSLQRCSIHSPWSRAYPEPHSYSWENMVPLLFQKPPF